MHFQWRQCAFAGWLLWLMIGGGIFIVIVLIVVCCCCCCCRRRKRRRGKVEYSQLDNPVYTIENPQNVPTPKTNEWRDRMSAKYGVTAGPANNAEAEVWN